MRGQETKKSLPENFIIYLISIWFFPLILNIVFTILLGLNIIEPQQLERIIVWNFLWKMYSAPVLFCIVEFVLSIIFFWVIKESLKDIKYRRNVLFCLFIGFITVLYEIVAIIYL